ncbi:MAG: hypothetical protein NW216_02240 [Hyphomicrobium sp.]|nr:hypothetical protein [Hyphomicrobium sp.]
MPMIELTDTEIETLIYALGIATDDLEESIADPAQTAEDKAAWAEYIGEINQVNTKLTALTASEAA